MSDARTKVIDIEVSQPVRTIAGLAGYTSVLGLVRLHGVPLGYIRVPVIGDCCQSTVVARAVIDHHADSILRHLIADLLATPAPERGYRFADLMDAPHPGLAAVELPTMTVAICTRDRPNQVESCLAAVGRLEYSNLDVLVVDNAPSNDTTEHLVSSAYPGVRYVREPRPGLDWARNRAIAECRGRILAFTDDDVLVDPGWARALGAAFAEDPDVTAVTGLVVPAELETAAQRLFEEYGGFGRGFERRWFRHDASDPQRSAGASSAPVGSGPERTWPSAASSSTKSVVSIRLWTSAPSRVVVVIWRCTTAS